MIEKWQQQSEEQYDLVYRKVAKRLYRLPDGSEKIFDILLSQPVAVMVAFDQKNEIIIAKQFRPGPEKILLELPAGVVDEGETPLQTAKRELLEETGYTGEFDFAGELYKEGYGTSVAHTFVVKHAHKIQEPKTEADEQIEVQTVTLEAFRAHLRTGQLTDVGSAYQALDYLGLLS